MVVARAATCTRARARARLPVDGRGAARALKAVPELAVRESDRRAREDGWPNSSGASRICARARAQGATSEEIELLRARSELAALQREFRQAHAVGARQHGAPSEAADALDYIAALDSFDELHGDRQYRDDPALVGGFAKLRGRRVMVLGQQKGRDTKENMHRNFGMVSPEGYRKAKRLIELAGRFELPIVTFVDTSGADPGSVPKSGRNPKRSRVPHHALAGAGSGRRRRYRRRR